MNSRLIASTLLAAVLIAPSVSAQVPHGTPGSLPPNSFGGSGIPTDHVMLGGVNGVVLGLSATQRYTSPALGWDGVGTFFAQTGQSTGAPVNTGFAKWNFDYFVGGPGAINSFFDVFVDLDPLPNTPLGSLSMWRPTFTGGSFDSSNLGYVNGPFPGAFNPNTPGQYTISLVQYADAQHTQMLDYVAINVNVTATPEPASLALMSTGLIGLGAIIRRRNKA